MLCNCAIQLGLISANLVACELCQALLPRTRLAAFAARALLLSCTCRRDTTTSFSTHDAAFHAQQGSGWAREEGTSSQSPHDTFE